VKKGGHLASIHSVSEAASIMAMTGGHDSWIGLSRESKAKPWSWTDKSTYGEEVIGLAGQRQLWKNHLVGHDSLCGRWGWGSSGVWDDVSCSEVRPFTCAIPPSSSKFFVSNERKTWAEAQASCRQVGGNLASLHSISEVKEAYEECGTLEPWLGLTRTSVKSPWTWEDGSAYGLSPLSDDGNELWRKAGNGASKNSGTEYLCGRWGVGGAWDDSPCNERKPFMCRLQAAPPNPPSAPPQAPGGCVDTPLFTNGYVLTCADFAAHGLCADGHVVAGKQWAVGPKYNYPEHNCCVCGKGRPMPPPAPLPPSSPTRLFEYYEIGMTFDEARKTCQADGGDLASIHSIYETQQAVRVSKNADSWIGLHRTSASTPWGWTDGSAYGQETLTENGAKDLMAKKYSGHVCGRWGWSGTAWDAVDCNHRLHFTCRFLPAPPAPPALPPSQPSPPLAPGVFQACKLDITANFGDGLTAFSKLTIKDGSGQPITGMAASTSCHHFPASVPPRHALDGNIHTKFLCIARTMDLIATFPSPTVVSGYDITTANDTPNRDPQSWTFSCRPTANAAWEQLSSVQSFAHVNARFASYGGFGVTYPTAPPVLLDSNRVAMHVEA